MIFPALAFLIIVDTAPNSHMDAIRQWAGIMAEKRTAAELCPGYVIDDEVLEAILHKLGIADVDYFAFRPIAAAKADALKASLTDPAKREAWCQDECARRVPVTTKSAAYAITASYADYDWEAYRKDDR